MTVIFETLFILAFILVAFAPAWILLGAFGYVIFKWRKSGKSFREFVAGNGKYVYSNRSFLNEEDSLNSFPAYSPSYTSGSCYRYDALSDTVGNPAYSNLPGNINYRP